MSKKLRVGIIFGGRSGEHEVSLMSARSVVAALDPEKYEVMGIGITRQGRWLLTGNPLSKLLHEAGAELQAPPDSLGVALAADPSSVNLVPLNHHPGTSDSGKSAPDRSGEVERQRTIEERLRGERQEREALIEKSLGGDTRETLNRPDVVIPLIHGTHGEDGSLQGLLELAEVPYVGSGVLASAVGMDKAVFKALMQSHGVPVAPFHLIVRTPQATEHERERWKALADELGFPLFVKPANGGSSLGVTKLKRSEDLLEAIAQAAEYDPRVLLERAIAGRELECAVLGNAEPEASIAGEVIPGHEFYDYEDKYFDDKARTEIPARISPEQMEAVRDLSVRAFKAIDGAGMARVDFFLEEATGELFVNEINTIPGFTRISMYPKLWEASGVPFSRLLDRLILLALERAEQLRARKLSP
jgi:D-alanine-D-alanine ligase